MKVLVCLDSFKGSLTALQAGNAVKKGILSVNETANVSVCPISDGGEGFLDAILYCQKGKKIIKGVSGPLGEKIEANYGILSNNVAVIEASSCIGLPLLKKEQQNPLYTTTFGVGELIKDAISKGCKTFIIGIGGSCTNDGGVGMLQALGYQFLDKNHSPIKQGAIGLKDLICIKNSNAIDLTNISFNVACDVKNGLIGKNGASHVYAKQKGATEVDIINMDNWLNNFAKLTKKLYPNANENSVGAGASGGLGFAFKEYLKANLTSGIDLIINNVNLEEKIKNADIVIVGEGKLDSQSLNGKAPFGIAKLAKKHNKKVIALAGLVSCSTKELQSAYIDCAYSIIQSGQTTNYAMQPKVAINNLIITAKQIFKTNY